VIFPRDDARRDYPLMRGPHEFIEDQVERTPDAPALTLGPEQISYLELNSRAKPTGTFSSWPRRRTREPGRRLS